MLSTFVHPYLPPGRKKQSVCERGSAFISPQERCVCILSVALCPVQQGLISRVYAYLVLQHRWLSQPAAPVSPTSDAATFLSRSLRCFVYPARGIFHFCGAERAGAYLHRTWTSPQANRTENAAQIKLVPRPPRLFPGRGPPIFFAAFFSVFTTVKRDNSFLRFSGLPIYVLFSRLPCRLNVSASRDTD